MCKCCGCDEGWDIRRTPSPTPQKKRNVQSGNRQRRIEYDDEENDCCFCEDNCNWDRCCCEKGQVMAIVGLILTVVSLALLCILWANFCNEYFCVGIYTGDEFLLNKYKGVIYTTRVFHLIGIACLFTAFTIWCLLVVSRNYDGKTIPVFILLIFTAGAEVGVVMGSSMWTFAINPILTNEFYAIIFWTVSFLTFLTFPFCLVILLCLPRTGTGNRELRSSTPQIKVTYKKRATR